MIIHTPFAARATGVRVDGVEVDNFTTASDLGRLQVNFPDQRITRSGQEVAVRFASLVTVSGTEFRGEVADSQSDAFPQRVAFGDAAEEAADNTLVVSARIDDELFTGVVFSSAVITPNGDGINDQITLDYILLKATHEVEVEVVVYDLSGRPVHRLYQARDRSGPNQVSWDGRDADGVVPPGMYLLRLKAATDAGIATQMRSIAVVY